MRVMGKWRLYGNYKRHGHSSNDRSERPVVAIMSRDCFSQIVLLEQNTWQCYWTCWMSYRNVYSQNNIYSYTTVQWIWKEKHYTRQKFARNLQNGVNYLFSQMHALLCLQHIPVSQENDNYWMYSLAYKDKFFTTKIVLSLMDCLACGAFCIQGYHLCNECQSYQGKEW